MPHILAYSLCFFVFSLKMPHARCPPPRAEVLGEMGRTHGRIALRFSVDARSSRWALGAGVGMRGLGAFPTRLFLRRAEDGK